MGKILAFCKRSILLYTVIYIIFFILFKVFCNHILGIEYRNWVYFVAEACIVIGGIVGIIQLVWQIPKKPIKITLVVLLTLALVYISPVILLFNAFAYVPEHHIEKDGKQYLACVHAFLHVNVNYHKDYGFCFKGYQVEFSENYGKGGYDPFEREEMPEPIHRN